jgi:ribonuclease D
MKTVYVKYDKERIPALAVEAFEGRIITIQTEGEAARAVDYLLSQPILGFDTETRPSFRKGVMYKVALMQVSTHDTCFLFRLNMMGGIGPSLRRLLEDESVLKVGLSLKDDFYMLHKLRGFHRGNFVDLQDYAPLFGIEDKSLQKLYANLFEKKITKTQRLTNWEADVLTDKQKLYAATDAWSCIRIYEELQKMLVPGSYQLIAPPVVLEEPADRENSNKEEQNV